MHDHDLGKAVAVGIEFILLVGNELCELGMPRDTIAVSCSDKVLLGFAAFCRFDRKGILEAAFAGGEFGIRGSADREAKVAKVVVCVLRVMTHRDDD